MGNYFYEFVEEENGQHQIGGKQPIEFKFPGNNFISNFQYLGFINNNDKLFNWLPFKLHLICPIYLNIDKIYLDYSSQNQPKLISPKNTAEIDSEYLELTTESYLDFEERKVTLVKSTEIDDMECIGISNKLFKVQNLNIPRCPKSGNKMKFVCQLMTFGEIPVNKRNFESEDENLDYMNFWCDGSLFVFCEPISKTVCYFIQST